MLVRNNHFFHYAILTLLLVAMNFYVFFFFPATEGWWQTYAYLLKNGMKPYENFNMAFPPLFIYYNLVLIKISNYFVVYRIVGIIQVVVIFVLLAQALRKFYSVIVSLIASFLGVALMMNNYLFIPNDYHAFVNLLTLAGIYCYLEFRTSERKSSKIAFIMLTALFLVATLLVKQNIGLFVSLALIAILLIEDYRNNTIYFLYFLASYLLIFAGLCGLLNLSVEQFWDITFQNDAKGSLTTLAFNFFLNDINRKYFYLSCALAAFYIYVQRSGRQELFNKGLLWVCSIAIPLLIYQHLSPLISYVIICTLAYMWIELVSLRESKLGYDVLLIFFSLVYANTLTADITMMYLFIVSAFLIAKMLAYCELNYTSNKFKILIFGLLILFFSAHIHDKYKFPYEWWGRQSKIRQATYALPYEQLRYIRVDKATANLFEAVKEAIDSDSNGNDVYLFPHIPVFYELHNKLPMTRNMVQWFDVITQKNMDQEVLDIKKLRPNLVVILTPTAGAYAVHEIIRKMPQAQSQIPKYLDSQVAQGKYRLIKYQINNNDIFGNEASAEGIITMEYQVLNPKVFNQIVADLDTASKRISIIKINSNGQELYYKEMLGHKLQPYDRVTIQSPASQVDLLAQLIGTPDDLAESLSALKVYKKLGG